MQQSIHVRAIIKRGDKVLLLRRSDKNKSYTELYELPGGTVSFGEDPKAALQREVLEEIGKEIDRLQIFDTHSMLDSFDARKQYIVLSFIVDLKSEGRLELSADHDKYSWARLSDIQLSQVTETTSRVLELGSFPSAVSANSGVYNTTHDRKFTIYADGGSRGNPGPSASGFVIKDTDENIVFESGKYLGITTNNQAEYNAVKIALEKAKELNAKEINVMLDSQLVVNQLNGIYRVNNRDLWPIHSYIKDLIKSFEKVNITHIRREYNKEADLMVNKILDEKTGRRKSR